MGEFPEYYNSYISLIPDQDIEEILRRQHRETASLLNGVSEEVASRSYAPGKWSLKEVVGHMSDTERVMSHRMLALARGEGAPLHGMDQDLYVSSANFNQFPWTQVRAELATVRAATLSLLASIDDAGWIRTGTVWNSSVSTRAFPFIIAGHEMHHVGVIRDKYL